MYGPFSYLTKEVLLWQKIEHVYAAARSTATAQAAQKLTQQSRHGSQPSAAMTV